MDLVAGHRTHGDGGAKLCSAWGTCSVGADYFSYSCTDFREGGRTLAVLVNNFFWSPNYAEVVD